MIKTGYYWGQNGPQAGSLIYNPDYWANSIEFYAEKWSQEQQNMLKFFQIRGARIAYWRSDKDGRPCNGGDKGFLPIAAEGVLHMVSGKPVLCTHTCLHATLKPPRWNGSVIWIVALIGEVIGDEDKFGAQAREILGQCTEVPDDWIKADPAT